jgi:20S proteasome alpha/beta subunit
MTFTKEQREAIEQTGSIAVSIEGLDCVVLRADVYRNQV